MRYWQACQEKGDSAEELGELSRRKTALEKKKQRLVAAIAEGVINFVDAKGQRMAIESEFQEIQCASRIYLPSPDKPGPKTRQK